MLMVALAQSQEIQGSPKVEEQISHINLEIERLNSKLEKKGDLVLVVSEYCNGEHQKTEMTVLDSYWETAVTRETVQELQQVRSTLESMGISGNIGIVSENGDLIAKTESKSKLEEAETINIYIEEGESAFQKLAELIYGDRSKSFVVQSLDQLNEIIKFGEKFGMESIRSVPELQELTVEDIAVIRANDVEHIEIQSEIPLDAQFSPSAQYRTEAQIISVENGVAQAAGQVSEMLPPLEIEEMSPRYRIIDAKIRRSIEIDMAEAERRNQKPRKSLLEIHNYATAA